MDKVMLSLDKWLIHLTVKKVIANKYLRFER